MTFSIILSLVVGVVFLAAIPANVLAQNKANAKVATARSVVHADIRGTKIEFSKFENPSADHTFWGEFSSPHEEVERFHYHFFPDRKFVVATSCDMCPQTPIAEGNFAFSKGKISLKYKTRKGKRLLASPLYVLHGYDNPVGDADKKYEMIILDRENYFRAIQGKPDFSFVKRTDPYRDWQEIYSRLKIREKLYGPHMTPDGYPKALPPK